MLFYQNIHEKTEVTYSALIAMVNTEQNGDVFQQQPKTRAIIRLVKLMVSDSNFKLSEFNKNEIQFTNNQKKLSSPEDLISKVLTSQSKIILTTSGTTGQPKEVTHSLESLLRSARVSSHHREDRWGLAFSIFHMSGLQVFLQAILNLNPLVDLTDLTVKDQIENITLFKLTHLSGTPTFYRNLLSHHFCITSLKRISLGGESSNKILIEKLTRAFPNAKITNIYASTESGALLASINDHFKIPEDRQGQIRIINNQIHVQESLLGKFGSLINDGWYNTLDTVEWADEIEGTFRIVRRDSELLNIGGFKVNPHRVEEALEEHQLISGVKVFGRKNTVLGTILCCNIVARGKISELELSSFLKMKLETHEIPRRFYFVEHLDTTHTGKAKKDELG